MMKGGHGFNCMLLTGVHTPMPLMHHTYGLTTITYILCITNVICEYGVCVTKLSPREEVD